jgi:hypothetical protein
MTFDGVVPALRNGQKIRRQSWGHTVMVYILGGLFQWPHADMAIKSWRLEPDDLMADDWEIVS